MNAYAVIEIGGKQLQVEPGRFYDVRHLNPEKLGPNSKILIYRVLMICNESTINIGHPWLKGAIIRGRILHSRPDNKITVCRMRSRGRTQCKLGHRQRLIRFVVDSICSDVGDLYKRRN
uniref:ribosomal protein L21 n=1 Tax=Phylloglossum drummondii TaxID=70003 RepID=UPI003002C9E1|nr:ribosomal protein L21 [Phylloglossum drummondii]